MGWGENERGVSFTFGEDVVQNFLKRHDLDLICRAHQVRYGGWVGGWVRALTLTLTSGWVGGWVGKGEGGGLNELLDSYGWGGGWVGGWVGGWCTLVSVSSRPFFLPIHPPTHPPTLPIQVVEDGYEFFARRQLVTLFSAVRPTHPPTHPPTHYSTSFQPPSSHSPTYLYKTYCTSF